MQDGKKRTYLDTDATGLADKLDVGHEEKQGINN